MSLAGADVALDVSDAARRELAEELPMFGSDRLARLLGVLGDLSAELKTSTNQRLSFEIALTRMVRPDSDLTLESLAERIESLEAGRSATSPVFAQAATPASCRGAASSSQPQPQPQSQDRPQCVRRGSRSRRIVLGRRPRRPVASRRGVRTTVSPALSGNRSSSRRSGRVFAPNRRMPQASPATWRAQRLRRGRRICVFGAFGPAQPRGVAAHVANGPRLP